ncbi:MAG: hypothetical protein IT285_00700, partial [Bdellovibrionales bacterium]|nr:hypothetical protein [Bdellovibrionales bacterium]
WFHSFVMAFPLAALALDRAWARRERMAILLAGSGVVLIALLTSKVAGKFGLQLEHLSVKSWGIVLCLWALKRSSGRRIVKGAALA